MARTYTLRPGVTFSREGMHRALDSHRDAGLIRDWQPRPLDEPETRGDHWLWKVTGADGTEVRLYDPRELQAFLCGLASARAATAQAVRRGIAAGQAAARTEQVPA